VVGIPSAEFTLSAVEVLRTGIGRNGAGKSTLPSTRLRARLKILSRITEPTGACRVVALAESASGKV
jgi:ABC-type polysaccharide/polyol phosphate transport system ATPase subunit